MADHDPLRFPIGPFAPKASLSSAEREELIEEIAHFPADLRFMVTSLAQDQLETPYREGGWTVRQVVHHLPDSHMQSYARFKYAMTEEIPTVKTYQEADWAETEDARTAPVDISLDLLDALHQRWAFFLRGLTEADWQRSFLHPEVGEINLETTLQLYVWHGRHHLAHIRMVAER